MSWFPHSGRLTLTIALLLFPALQYGQDARLDPAIADALTDLSAQYTGQFPVTATKTGLVVIPFRENSEPARRHQLGRTLANLMRDQVVAASRVFYLVDRSTMPTILEEIALSQSGLVRGDQVVRAGEMAGARVVLTGAIGEVGDRFVVQTAIVDVESARVVASHKLELPREQLIRRRQVMALETIAQYGLGINFQWSTAFIESPEDNVLQFTDVYLNYRPFLWLNFKLGVSAMALDIRNREVDAARVYPAILEQSEATITTLDYDGGDADLVSPYVGLEYNRMLGNSASLAVGGSYVFGRTEMIQQYSNGVFYDDDDGLLKPIKTFRVEQELDPLHIGRIEAKGQFFLSPRMTLALYGSFLLASDINIDRSIINNEYREFPDEGDPPPAEFRERYLEMPTKIVGNGEDLEDIDLNGGWAIGLAFNFYF